MDTAWVNRIVGHGEESPEQLVANPRNWRIHPRVQQKALAGVIADVGFVRSVTVNRRTGFVVDGHLRVLAAISTGQPTIPVEYIDVSEDEEAEILLTLDPIAALAGTDSDLFASLLDSVGAIDADVLAMLNAMPRNPERQADAAAAQARLTLAQRFIIPPFSVLDARQGYWQERKRAWIDLGIQSELGRGANTLGLSDATEEYRQNYGDYAKDGAAAPRANLTFVRGKNSDMETMDPVSRMILSTRVHRPGDGRPGSKPSHLLKGQDEGRTNRLVPGGAGAGTAWQSRNDHGTFETEPRAMDSAASSYHDHDWQARVLGHIQAPAASGTSIFDPVVCELSYTWFCPPGGRVLDPCAGGSVRGIVAAMLGRAYVGIDLSAAQIAANETQARAILGGGGDGANAAIDDLDLAAPAEKIRPMPYQGADTAPVAAGRTKAKSQSDLRLAAKTPWPCWLVGDGRDVGTLAASDTPYDFLFTCPPYADLERYSDDPRDLSTMPYDQFIDGWRAMIRAGVDLLAHDRFAAVVVGDVRAPDGTYRNFVSDTIAGFLAAGCALYNESILVTAVGSLAIRVGRQFVVSRKVGKTHQNVLVFVKGDARRATANCGEIDVYVPDADPEMLAEENGS